MQWTCCTEEVSTDSALSQAIAITQGWQPGFRESGMFVMGVGRSNTPKPFVNACEVFVCTENLASKKGKNRPKVEKSQADWTKLVAKTISKTSNEDGWAPLTGVGSNLKKLKPPFESKKYGHKQLSKLIKSRQDLFEVKGKSPVRVRLRT